MPKEIILVLAATLLIVLLLSEWKTKPAVKLVAKTLLSGLFVAAALVQPHPVVGYYRWLTMGLVFCLAGDVCLALPGRQIFLAGLASFVTGHLLYVAAFVPLARLDERTAVGALVVVAVSSCVFAWLRPHLHTMKLPVLGYVVVISLMLCSAWSAFGNPRLPLSGRIMILAGTLAFYLSDLFVARDRFLGEQLVNRLVGLPLYYAGQFLLAFSVGMVG
jgi:uncharacterized membrane protein YhhN